MQTFIHYFLHLVFPIFISKIFFKNNWKKAFIIILFTMIIDLDHLLATPIFDANRCSLGFHPLHTGYALLIYLTLFYFTKTRIISIGLIFHIFTDFIDCLITYSKCSNCKFPITIHNFF